MALPRPMSGKVKGQKIKKRSESTFDKGVWVRIGFESDKVLCTTMNIVNISVFCRFPWRRRRKRFGEPSPSDLNVKKKMRELLC